LIIPSERDRGSSTQEGKYEGGVILEAIRGYYQEPCAVLDFASLYPSIMMAHNLCYSTIIPQYRVKDHDPEEIEKTPNGEFFIKKEKYLGVLPQILDDLVSARRSVKKQLKTETDPLTRTILESR
jgi:DNA polymerase delta subunit 1